MYNELEYRRVQMKSLDYKRLITKHDNQAKRALISLGVTVVLYLIFAIIGTFHPIVYIVASLATTYWLAMHIYHGWKAAKYHTKRAVTESYLAKHKYDFNIDKRINKEI